jgi:hypothetical protein
MDLLSRRRQHQSDGLTLTDNQYGLPGTLDLVQDGRAIFAKFGDGNHFFHAQTPRSDPVLRFILPPCPGGEVNSIFGTVEGTLHSGMNGGADP